MTTQESLASMLQQLRMNPEVQKYFEDMNKTLEERNKQNDLPPEILQLFHSTEMIKMEEQLEPLMEHVNNLYHQKYAAKNLPLYESTLRHLNSAIDAASEDTRMKAKVRLVHGMVWRKHAQALTDKGQHRSAREALVTSIRELLGVESSYPLPSKTGVNDAVRTADMDIFAVVVDSSLRIAQLYAKDQDIYQVRACTS